ncbi:MAG: right-handed parallel beta-helix repeat-containing protein [Bacilli bacterium]|jgi:hypothetical protein
MSGEHIRGIPRTYEKEITLADTPYTLSVGFNCVKVDTTGGNVRVNLPNVNYPIDVIKTSSDSYIVTVWVGGVQIGEVAGESSIVTVEDGEVVVDELWYPYDVIVGIAGNEVIARDRFGHVIARGVAGTDDDVVRDAAISRLSAGGRLIFAGKHYWSTQPVWPSRIIVEGYPRNTEIHLLADITPFYIDKSDIRVSNLDIYTYSNQTKSILCVAAIVTTPRKVKFETINITCVGSFYGYDAIELVADGTRSILHADFYNIYANRINHLVYIHSLTPSAWINSCKFDRIYGDYYVTLVEVENVLPLVQDSSSGNMFLFVQGEVCSETVNGFIIDGKFNTFVGCHLWDWVHRDPFLLLNHAWYFSPDSYNNTVIGPFVPEWDSYVGQDCVNLGTKNNLLFAEKGVFASKSIVTVGDGNGYDYGHLKDAVDAISMTTGSPHSLIPPVYIIIDGTVVEENATVLFDGLENVEVVGINNATVINNISSSTDIGNGVTVINSSKMVFRDITFINVGSQSASAFRVLDSPDLKFYNCMFESYGTTDRDNDGFLLSGNVENVKFYNCIFKGGAGENGYCFGCSEASECYGIVEYYNCKFEGNTTVSGFSGGIQFVNSNSKLYNCVAICGGKNHSIGFLVRYNSSPELYNCQSIPRSVDLCFPYSSADDGGFRPFDSSPWQLVDAHILILVAHPGVTCNIGTTPSGNDVASGIDISTTGARISLNITKVQLAVDAYLYITPSAPIANNSFKLFYTAIYNYPDGYACYINTSGPAILDHCTFKSNGASKCFYNAIASPKYTARYCVFDTHGTNNSIYSSPATNGAHIIKPVITSSVVGVTGIDGKSSGSSTGTGSEQAIPHGLAAIPTGCKAWKKIEYPVGSGRYITIDIPYDVTYVYPTVDNGVAFEWGIE